MSSPLFRPSISLDIAPGFPLQLEHAAADSSFLRRGAPSGSRRFTRASGRPGVAESLLLRAFLRIGRVGAKVAAFSLQVGRFLRPRSLRVPRQLCLHFPTGDQRR